MQELLDKWEELKKALSHKAAILDAKVPEYKAPEAVEPHPDNIDDVKYGKKAIPGAQGGTADSNIGFMKAKGKGYVVRHGSAAQRTDTEHQMSKLLGADHMLPDQSYDHGINHPKHHGQDSYDPHEHGGTSFQDHEEGKSLHEALDDKEATEKLKDQWKNGDLHKLWALHYISNNGDMHSGNFKVGKDGIKAFDSDNAFHELPSGHVMQKEGNGKPDIKYMPNVQKQLPAYLSPFVERENDEDIPADHKDAQVHVKALNEHAKNIDPELFKNFGPHAYDRAVKAKKALMSSDPTSEMQKAWDTHKDATGDFKWNKTQSQSKKKQVA